jgi:hypothetical protein
MGMHIDDLRPPQKPMAAMPKVIYDDGSVRKRLDELDEFIVEAIFSAAESAKQSGLSEIRIAVIGKKAAYWKKAKTTLRKKYSARTKLHRAYFTTKHVCVEVLFFSVFYNTDSLRGFHNFDACIYLGDWVNEDENLHIERLLKSDGRFVFVRVQRNKDA